MRYLYVVLGLLVVIAALAGVKYTQIASLIHMGAEMKKAGPPPEVVSTAAAGSESWEGTLQAIGSITAARGVSLSNDAPGVVTRINFESGQVVRAGQVLVELDSNVERAQLASAKARYDLAVQTAGRSRALVKSNSIAQSQLDNDEAMLKAATTDASGLQAQIDRKTVRAPFAGRLGIREVNLGQYLNPGTPLAVLEAIDSVYADFSVPQQRLGDIKVGVPVRISLDPNAAATGQKPMKRDSGDKNGKIAIDDPKPIDGLIAAVDPRIDSGTRSIKVRASVPNKDERLRPGMFATVSVILPQGPSVVTVPVTAILHASYGDSVFVAEDKKADNGAPAAGADGKPVKVARQQFVRTGESRGDFVAIDDGIKAGDEVVIAGAFKLHNGFPITVDNSVGAKAELSPHVENR